jgi:hypothetical protein
LFERLNRVAKDVRVLAIPTHVPLDSSENRISILPHS